MASKKIMLRVEGLSYSIDGASILRGISFNVYEGDRLAVFGPSGAGKSTLIRLLNRLDEPTSGQIWVDGRDYRQISPRVLRRRFGLVMQNPSLFPGTVAEKLRFGPEAHGEMLDDQAIQELLRGVDLEGFANRDVSTLSGGEAQRVNLARTLANKPELLLLDEPTSSLNQTVKQEVENTILEVLESQEVTCILVTHDQEQAKRMATRGLLLRSGELVMDGPIEEVVHA